MKPCGRPIVFQGPVDVIVAPCGVPLSAHTRDELARQHLPDHIFQPKAETTKRRAVRK